MKPNRCNRDAVWMRTDRTRKPARHFRVGRRYARGLAAAEGILNRVDAAIRGFDPCLIGATHEMERMPLDVPSVDADGDELRQIVGG